MTYVSALIWNKEGPYGEVLALRGEDGKLRFPMTAVHTAEESEQAVVRAAAEQLVGLVIAAVQRVALREQQVVFRLVV